MFPVALLPPKRVEQTSVIGSDYTWATLPFVLIKNHPIPSEDNAKFHGAMMRSTTLKGNAVFKLQYFLL